MSPVVPRVERTCGTPPPPLSRPYGLQAQRVSWRRSQAADRAPAAPATAGESTDTDLCRPAAKAWPRSLVTRNTLQPDVMCASVGLRPSQEGQTHAPWESWQPRSGKWQASQTSARPRSAPTGCCDVFCCSGPPSEEDAAAGDTLVRTRSARGKAR